MIRELNTIREKRNEIKNYKKMVKWFEEIPMEKISKIEPKLKDFKEKINKEYEIDLIPESIEKELGLKGFQVNYQIQGIEGLDPNQFFDRVEKSVIIFLEKNKQRKIRFVLNTELVKTDLSTNEDIYTTSHFHSDTYENL